MSEKDAALREMQLIGESLEDADRIKELEAQLKKAVEALRWCAGSPDFNEGGSAYEGWNKICAPIAYPLDAPKEE